jgi:hypothetical protein
MTRDDIIRMAREAGFVDYLLRVWRADEGVEKLARAAYEAGVAAEREACAKVAEKTVCDTHLPTGVKIYGTKVAAAIRARGQ